MKRKPKCHWLKERYNPQLGTYWVRCGQLSEAEAKRNERPLYGDNTMHAFASESEYQARIEELRKAGESIQ